MNIENGVLRVGGNTLLVWMGQFLKWIAAFLTEKGELLIVKGHPILITNPTAEMINPFTIILKFSVNNESYQLILQGNYISKYKEDKELLKFTEEEKFLTIHQHRKLWYKKENE